MLRANDIHLLQNQRSLQRPITGASSGLQEGEVVVVHKNGTLDARAAIGRSGVIGVRYPRWYAPQIGDRVLISELYGDERMRVVTQVLSTSAGAAPNLSTFGTTSATASAGTATLPAKPAGFYVIGKTKIPYYDE